MKATFKILSLCLTLLILTRSASLYAFCTDENAFVSKSQKTELLVAQNDNYTLVITDRTKVIDNSQPQKSRYGSSLLDYSNILIDKANTTILFSQSVTFKTKTENKAIFKEHYLTFPFHNFY
jgi:hypothetical protein